LQRKNKNDHKGVSCANLILSRALSKRRCGRNLLEQIST